MRRILVVSDTHGYTGNLDIAIAENRDVNLLIHLGDVCNDETYIERKVHYAVKIIRGNNDWSYSLPYQFIMESMGHKIYGTHGHRENVNFGIDSLVWKAREQGCDIVMFGHTHVPYIEQSDDLIIINPGSLTYPRQIGHKPSYIIMDLYENGDVECEIKYIEK